MDPTILAGALVRAAVGALWETIRRPALLVAVILSFVISAVISLIVSGLVFHGWWQAFFQNVGVSLLFVGIINLGILTALRGLTEGPPSTKGPLSAEGLPSTEGPPSQETEIIITGAANEEVLEQVRDALERIEQRLAGSG
jgi:hypothetical protein